MLYPIQLTAFQDRVGKWKYLAQRSATELQAALDRARTDVELYCIAAGDGLLDSRLDRACANLHSDLALYYLRFEVERDSETGAPPKSLDIMRQQLMGLLKRLSEQADASPEAYTIAAFEPMGIPDFPPDTPMFGSGASSSPSAFNTP